MDRFGSLFCFLFKKKTQTYIIYSYNLNTPVEEQYERTSNFENSIQTVKIRSHKINRIYFAL